MKYGNYPEREKLTNDETTLRTYCMSFPDTREDFPWGHRAFKVRNKIFVYMGSNEKETSISVKLPNSSKQVLRQFKNATPTHYGMGKYGWVTFTFDRAGSLPMQDIKNWVLESFAAIAPITLSKQMTTQSQSSGEATSTSAAKRGKQSSAKANDATQSETKARKQKIKV